jgi:hypothetical protein
VGRRRRGGAGEKLHHARARWGRWLAVVAGTDPLRLQSCCLTVVVEDPIGPHDRRIPGNHDPGRRGSGLANDARRLGLWRAFESGY